MNRNAKEVIGNLLCAFGANFISLALSAVTTLILPKVLKDVEQYAYWQLYIFYFSYVGFFHLGLVDGIYLRNGGKNYRDLDRELFSTKFRVLAVFETAVGAAVIIYSSFPAAGGREKRFVLSSIGLLIVLSVLRSFFFYILQATNRIREYAFYTRLDRCLFCVLLLFAPLIPHMTYRVCIVFDLIVRGAALILCMKCCGDLVFAHPRAGLVRTLSDMRRDISAGCRLMLGNIASTLITGIVRFGVEGVWSISVFGKISLVLNISNMILSFVNSVGMVLFPLLRRFRGQFIAGIYEHLETVLMISVFLFLEAYYPIRFLLSKWLPAYEDSFFYMGVLFPICVYECKTALLVMTYLKAKRMEDVILKVNLVAFLLSGLLTAAACLAKSLLFAVLSIVLALAFRCIAAETILKKSMGLRTAAEAAWELILTSAFIGLNLFFSSFPAACFYFVIYLTYAVCHRKKIGRALTFFRSCIG